MLKAVIFDMDDTLVDWSTSDVDWYTFDRQHLRRVFDYMEGEGFALGDFVAFDEEVHRRGEQRWGSAREDLRAPNLGTVIGETLEVLGVPRGRVDVNACLRAYNWQGFPGVMLFPEVRDVLARLRAAGLRFGLITNAYYPMWMRERELVRLGLSPDLFACRLSSADVGRLKPHPLIFHRAMTCLDVSPEEAIFVGDSPEADILGAQGVGMRAVQRVADCLSPAFDSLNPPVIPPDAVIYSLDELFPLLDDWFPGWLAGDH